MQSVGLIEWHRVVVGAAPLQTYFFRKLECLFSSMHEEYPELQIRIHKSGYIMRHNRNNTFVLCNLAITGVSSVLRQAHGIMQCHGRPWAVTFFIVDLRTPPE